MPSCANWLQSGCDGYCHKCLAEFGGVLPVRKRPASALSRRPPASREMLIPATFREEPIGGPATHQASDKTFVTTSMSALSSTSEPASHHSSSHPTVARPSAKSALAVAPPWRLKTVIRCDYARRQCEDCQSSRARIFKNEKALCNRCAQAPCAICSNPQPLLLEADDHRMICCDCAKIHRIPSTWPAPASRLSSH